MKSLKYANKDKSKNEGGWILDLGYLVEIQEQVVKEHVDIDIETIEVVLLVANGESNLL